MIVFISIKFSLRTAARCVILNIEKGKAIEAALLLTISLYLCYMQSAVTIGSSGGYFFFPL